MRVLKIGGNELDEPGFLERLASLVARWVNEQGTAVIIIHGGGRAIADLQSRLGLSPVKVDGLRVTDAASLEVAQMVLSGQTNKQIVRALLAAGVDAVGLSGVDGGLLRCRRKQHPTADLGLVGEVTQVRAKLLRQLSTQGLTLVLSPISLGLDGLTYNVNADDAATAVAQALAADSLDLLSNVPGVLHEGTVISALTLRETETLIQTGVIHGGMIPKVQAALDAVKKGVAEARIVNLEGLAENGGTRFFGNGGRPPTADRQ